MTNCGSMRFVPINPGFLVKIAACELMSYAILLIPESLVFLSARLTRWNLGCGGCGRIEMQIKGDVRNKVVRESIIPHLKTGFILENPKLGDWEVCFLDGELSLGRKAFNHMVSKVPSGRMVKTPHLN